MTVVAIIGVIFVIITLLVLTIVYYLRNRFRRRFTDLYPMANFISEARSFAQQSLGRTQVRGTGTLALTADALHLQLWLSNRTLDISLQSITHVDTTRLFLGKAMLSKWNCFLSFGN